MTTLLITEVGSNRPSRNVPYDKEPYSVDRIKENKFEAPEKEAVQTVRRHCTHCRSPIILQ